MRAFVICRSCTAQDECLELFCQAKAVSLILTTLPTECRLVYTNMQLAAYTETVAAVQWLARSLASLVVDVDVPVGGKCRD